MLKNIAAKMIKIMKDVDYVQKTGRNSFHKYSYATETDIAAAFSTAMQNHGVFMFSSVIDRECITYKTAGNKDSFMVTVKLEITFVDVDSGEKFVSTFFGDGTDNGDKAIYKAITGAQKYALMKTFLLKTGDDPECDNRIVDKVNDKKYENETKEDLIKSLKAVALLGSKAMKEKWESLSMKDKNIAKSELGELKKISAEVDFSKSPAVEEDLARGDGE